MAKPTPASGGFTPIEVPVRDETVGFTPLEFPSPVPVAVSEPESTDTADAPPSKKES